MTDIERMARMWNVEQMSMGEIAAALRVTRNTVSGIINRNRVMFEARRDANGKKPRAQRTTKPRQPIITASQKANQRRKAFHAVKVAEEAAAAPVTPVEPEIDGKEYDTRRRPFAKDLLAIRDCECKWWVSEGPLMFCAEEVVLGKSWCKHHLDRSKGKGTISEQKAVTDAKRMAA